jgi:hypothetical protein
MFTQIQDKDTRIELLNNELYNLCQDINNQDNELTKKQGTIEYLKRQQRQPSVLSNANVTNTKYRAKMDDPDKFSGKDGNIDFDT